MSLLELIAEKQPEILKIAAEHGVRDLRLFGSAARGEDGPTSDVDLLVKMDKGHGYFDLIDLQDQLQQLLGRKVDAIFGLHYYIEDAVLKEAVPLGDQAELRKLAVIQSRQRGKKQRTVVDRDALSLIQMRDATEEVLEFWSPGIDAVLTERMRLLSILRLLEVLGEAANRVSKKLQSAHPEVPWADIVGLRNIVIHNYDRIEYDKIWEALDTSVPALKGQLAVIFEQRGQI